MVHMVHFASQSIMMPLLRHYKVDPLNWRSWDQAPPWLKKMWQVSQREWQRSRKIQWKPCKKKNGRVQHWFHYHSGKRQE